MTFLVILVSSTSCKTEDAVLLFLSDSISTDFFMLPSVGSGARERRAAAACDHFQAEIRY